MGLHSQRAIVMRGDPGLFDIVKKGLGFVARTAARTFIPSPILSVARTITGRQFPPPIALPAAPAGLRFPGRGTSQLAPAAAAGGGCPKGFHANKSSYHTAAGFVEAGTRCVRNRRRNLSNGRANTRALRRMSAWEKQDKKRRQTLAAIARSAK